MTPWTWFAGNLDDDVYGLAEEDTREKVIASALDASTGWLKPGDQFRIIGCTFQHSKEI